MEITSRMKTILLAITLCLALPLAARANLLENGDFSRGKAGWRATNFPHRVERNRFVAEIPVKCGKFAAVLLRNVELKRGTNYRLSFTVECENKGIFTVVYQQATAPYTPQGLRTGWKLEAGVHKRSVDFVAEPRDGEHTRLTFNFSRLPGRAILSEVRLEEIPVLPLTLNPRWTVFTDEETVRNPGHFPAGPGIAATLENNRIDLTKITPGKFRPGQSVAVLYNRFQASEDGIMPLGVSADWFYDVYLNGKLLASGRGTPALSPDDNRVDLPVTAGKNLLAIVIRGGRDGWKLICGESRPNIRFSEGNGWKKYQYSSLADVAVGSALDLSGEVEAPAGRLGRLTVSPKGELVFARKPGTPVRLLGFNGGLDFLMDEKEPERFRENARRFAQQARRQGYRLFRVHPMLDRICEGGEEGRVSPELLDRWDYLIAELKKEGIYLHLVIFSFRLYGKEIQTFADWNYHKLMMYLDGEWEFERFRYAVDTLFAHVNPYTGIAWKDEPAIAFVEYYNEQSLGIVESRVREVFRKHPEAKKRLRECFRKWRQKRYGTAFPATDLPFAGNGEAANAAALFWRDRALVCAQKCEAIVRGAGYRGLVSQYTYSRSFGHAEVRWQTSQVADIHAYFNHPVGDHRARGSYVGSNSSVAAATGYWRNSNAGRLLGRPFICGEYNHSFYNPYRYELGMVFGGYSALQGYGALEIHHIPIFLDGKPRRLSPFAVGSSPMLRAAQFLTACLFQRGDVRSSPHQAALLVNREFLGEAGNANKAVNWMQSKLALLIGFGLVFPERTAAPGVVARPRFDIAFLPAGSSAIRSEEWFSDVIETGGGFSLRRAVSEMKRRGILASGNLSDPEREIFHSDTGELYLSAREKLMKAVSARTEAVCLPAGTGAALKRINVENTSVSACVAVSSIDSAPLAESRRMVLLYLTEEANSDMELLANRATLWSIGSLPVLARTGKLQLTLRRTGNWKLHALGIDGRRREEIAVEKCRDGIRTVIDTDKLTTGPTPFFELVEESTPAR